MIIIITMIIVVETKIEHSNFLSSSTDFEMHTKIVNVLVRVFWVCVPQNCFKVNISITRTKKNLFYVY